MIISQIAHDEARRRQRAADFARRRYLIRAVSNATTDDFVTLADAEDTINPGNGPLGEAIALAWHVIANEADMLAAGALPSEI